MCNWLDGESSAVCPLAIYADTGATEFAIATVTGTETSKTLIEYVCRYCEGCRVNSRALAYQHARLKSHRRHIGSGERSAHATSPAIPHGRPARHDTPEPSEDGSDESNDERSGFLSGRGALDGARSTGIASPLGLVSSFHVL